jgi:two-component system sensor histidine kinase KdpD
LSRGRPIRSREHVLALATPEPRVRATVHHAYRAAQRLDAPLDVLWVRPPGAGSVDDGPGGETAALERLVQTLGGTLLVRAGRDLVAVTREVAIDRGVTYVVVGRPRDRMPLARLRRRELPLRLMDAVPGADVQIVALGRSGP